MCLVQNDNNMGNIYMTEHTATFTEVARGGVGMGWVHKNLSPAPTLPAQHDF